MLVVEGILGCVFVLVEGIEMSRRELLQDSLGVSTAAKSDIGIYAFGVQVEAPDALAQHDRIVIHRVALPYLMFLRISRIFFLSTVAIDCA